MRNPFSDKEYTRTIDGVPYDVQERAVTVGNGGPRNTYKATRVYATDPNGVQKKFRVRTARNLNADEYGSVRAGVRAMFA